MFATYAGYMITRAKLEEWSNAQQDPKYVECRSLSRTGAFGALRRYLEKNHLSRHIGLELLPFKSNATGGVDLAHWHLMFHRRNGEYSVPLSRFSAWDSHRESDNDVKYKKILEDLEIEVEPWSVACWVGKIGLFYDFSPEVLAGISNRRKAARAQKENAEVSLCVGSSMVIS
ncbi:hypothetical protein BDV93DRAFT_528221 [Ceratobasidium sp. AG-I]|nr:hypothetical protein BDV93DRAFT_528221 [Ceratobasidium sp. AG-I]